MDANIYLKDSAGNPLGTASNPLVVYPATDAFDVISPLTTKGDMLVFGTTDTRLAVATDNYVLTCSTASDYGVQWRPLSAINGVTSATTTSTANTVPIFNDTSGNVITTSPLTVTASGALYTPASSGIGIGTGAAPSYLIEIKGTTNTDGPTLGSEFLDGDNWTTTGWTGSWESGFTHTTGNTNVLSHDHAAVSSTKYQIAYTVTGRTAGSFTITFGGQSWSGITATGAWGPKATGTGYLQIIPTSDFNGTIVISIRSITAGAAPVISITNSSGTVVGEIRAHSVDTNTFLGRSAGYSNTTGYSNTFLGRTAGYNNTTGHDNTFIGRAAGYSNTTGYSNTFLGGAAGYNNTTGYDNTFLGRDAGVINTTGYSNTFLGRDAGYNNTTGYDNTFLGRSAGFTNSTGKYNTFLGVNAGYNANQKADAANSMGLGYGAFTTRNNQVVIGDHNVVETQLRANVYIGSTSSTSHTQPTAKLHIAAGSATAGTAPIKLTAGTLLTTPEAGAIEFNTDDFYATITTGPTRQKVVLTSGLTSGKIPIATTNGRLTDGQTPLAGTKVYYVADSSGGSVNRKLTFIDGILVSET